MLTMRLFYARDETVSYCNCFTLGLFNWIVMRPFLALTNGELILGRVSLSAFSALAIDMAVFF